MYKQEKIIIMIFFNICILKARVQNKEIFTCVYIVSKFFVLVFIIDILFYFNSKIQNKIIQYGKLDRKKIAGHSDQGHITP